MIEAADAVGSLTCIVDEAINIKNEAPSINFLFVITAVIQEGLKVVAPAWYDERWIIGELLLCYRCHISLGCDWF